MDQDTADENATQTPALDEQSPCSPDDSYDASQSLVHVGMMIVTIFGAIVITVIVISLMVTCCRTVSMRRKHHVRPRVTPVVVSLPPRTINSQNPPAYPGYAENCSLPPPYSVVITPSAPPPYGFNAGVNPSAAGDKAAYYY